MIKVQSENIAEKLMFMLNKNTNEFSEEELSTIKTFVINSRNIDGNIEENIDFEILKYMNNLEEIALDSLELDDNFFDCISNSKKLNRMILNCCNIIAEYELEKLPISKMEFLSTSLSDWQILEDMPNLNEVVFTKRGYDSNLDVVKKLENHNIKVTKYGLF